MFVDFINIGYRKDINAGSLGTMLMWKNLTALYQEAAENNLNLYYSYGMMSGEYKTRWCHPVSLGRSIICILVGSIPISFLSSALSSLLSR